MNIILAGGTGLIGKELLNQLIEKKHTVTLLKRNSKDISSPSPFMRVEIWDGKNLGNWVTAFDDADAVINLSGEPIAAKRWTSSQKEKILSSRIDSTRAIVSAIKESKKKPTVLVNASAVGYYGNVESGDVTELHEKGKGFLADVCARWEDEALQAEQLGVRVALLRTGIVLHKEGGALQKMLPPFKYFVGGKLGNGNQWFPWIHFDDEIQIILFAMEHNTITGAVNLASPNPITNKDFSSALGKTIHRPSIFPVPAYILKMMLGEMSEMLLGGQKVIPEKLLRAGYKFSYPNLTAALNSLLK